MSRGVGAEISRVMRKQTDLERRFENLLSRRETLVRAANKAPYLENQQRVSETAAELRVTTNDLCVNLKESPDVFANLRFAVAERAELTTLVAETVDSLGEEGVFSRLVRKRVKEEAAGAVAGAAAGAAAVRTTAGSSSASRPWTSTADCRPTAGLFLHIHSFTSILLSYDTQA